MAPPLRRGRALAQQRLVGVLFLVVLAGVVWLAVLMYQKAFTPVMTVTLKADRIGNQLTEGGDVKARGVIIGTVRSVSSTGDGADVELAIEKDHAGLLPEDVTARLLPKTLFGEKFVALYPPEEGASGGPRLSDGDVIAQDRSQTARETATALDNLLPLLQTLKPQQVSVTLNALSTALRGRGDQLGQNLEIVDTYLQELNPELPRLEANNRGLADYADILNEAAPDFLQVLDNLSFLNRSLVDQEDELSTFLTSTTGFATETGGFLAENEQRFITLAADSRPTLELFERYSPQYPCLLDALERQLQVGNLTLGGLQPGLHISLEITQNQAGYLPGDQPRFSEDSGPTCRGLVGEPIIPFPADIEPADGYCDEEEQSQPGQQNGCRGRGTDAEQGPPAPPAAALAVFDPARALAPHEVEKATVGAALGPVLGVPPSEVPDLATLLFGPVARGTTVVLD